MKKFLIILFIIAAVVVLLYVSLLIYIADKAKQDTKIKSDVIVVLGEEAYGAISCYGLICQHGFVPHPHYNPCLVVRVDHAVSLYKNHYAPKFLCLGEPTKKII